MNIRKPTNYSDLFSALNKLMAANLPQMELYCDIGRLVNSRLEKGAAVATAEYLQSAYPGATGFSPRNLRRMRNFYRTYGNTPGAMAEAMTIGWTQNVVILEADLTLHARVWYIRAVRQFGWSKLKLVEQIASSAHQEIALDLAVEVCYTGENDVAEHLNDNQHSFNLQQSKDRIHDEGSGEKIQTGSTVLHRASHHQHQENWQLGLFIGPREIGLAWDQLYRGSDMAVSKHRLRSIRLSCWNRSNQAVEYVSLLWLRLSRQGTSINGVHRPP